MNQLNFPILSILIFLPLVGMVGILFVPRGFRDVIRGTAFLFAAATFATSLLLLFFFDANSAEMQFVEQVPWIPELGISYHLGVDGISLFLVLLTTLLTTLAIAASWKIEHRVKEYMAFMLLLETGMIGVFVTLDLFAFFVFWEAALIPMYFLIGIWGHDRRIYATVKFVLYTMTGSALMLVAILALAYLNQQATQTLTFDLLDLQRLKLAPSVQTWLFLAFAIAFAIKVPMFPFHTWLPDAHVEAPTAGSVILAGILLKMGTYGFVRFCLPLFPDATRQFVPLIVVLAIIGIIYGAWVAYAQRDVKSLVAFSSVSHLGFVMLGIFALNAQGLSGSVLQMVNHGLSTGALFLLVGMISDRRHTRLIGEFGGLWKQMPVYAVLFLVVMLSSVGLPGLNGFVGEFLVLVGAFQANPWFAVFGALGVILAAVYLFSMFQRVFFGELTNPANRDLPDLDWREIATLVPVVILVVLIGVFPAPFLGPMQASISHLLSVMAR
jgi:NADH-quinone oxidoreductase subunit M